MKLKEALKQRLNANSRGWFGGQDLRLKNLLPLEVSGSKPLNVATNLLGFP